MKNKKQGIVGNQNGMVSIIVTMILIILMTLIVLAMSQNANREQRQALDRQLSDQAFYNAESAINDWANYIYGTQNAPADKTDCESDKATLESQGFPGEVPDSRIDGPDGVNTYSCILYDKTPTSLEYDNVDTSDSIIVSIQPTELPGSSTLRTMTFTWRAGEGDSNTSGCNLSATAQLPQSMPANCNVGGLRIDLINTNGSRSAINQNNYPAFLLPGNGGGSLAYNPGSVNDQGAIGRADCSSGDQCRLTLTGLNLSNGEGLILHMRSLYNINDVSITGCHSNSPACSGGNPNQVVDFGEAQIEIDATGKANDVLRRVQVRIPSQSQYDTPGSFSIRTTQSVCKLIDISDPRGQANIDGRCLP